MDKDIELLVWKHLEGECSDEETAELRGILATRPDGMQHLFRSAADLADLIAYCKQKESAAERPAGGARFHVMHFRRRLAMAAAVVLAAAGVWWGIRNAERGMSERSEDPAAAGRSAERRMAVARVVDKVSGVRFQACPAGGGVSGGRWSDLRVGDEVREGTRIETGERGKVKLAFGAKGTDIAAGEHSALNIQRSTSNGEKIVHLERGKLSASVAKLKSGMAFVVMTPQARVEVKGTRFSLGVEAESTRLEVLEGLVGIERLSDAKSVDVAAGQYAVAADGVDLVALALGDDALRAAETAFRSEMRGMSKSRYGRVLFDDEFDGTLANWDVVVGTEGGGYRVLTGDPAPYARLEKNLRQVQNKHKPDESVVIVESCLVLDAGPEPDGLVWIRSKKPIEAERFVVEMRSACSLTGRKGKSWQHGLGIDVSEANVRDETVKSPWSVYGQAFIMDRWEFIPAEGAAESGDLYCRMFMGPSLRLDQWDKVSAGFFRSCYMRPESRRLMFGIKGPAWREIIDRVVVKEILDDSVAESGLQ